MYEKNIPRVSTIVEFVYSFKGTDSEQFFHNWLEKSGVNLDDYMNEASTGGTYIHNALEKYILNGEVKAEKYADWIISGINFLKDYKVEPLHTELYVKCKDYQGTTDLIGRIDGEAYVLDWKTYGLAKHKFGLYKGRQKPTSKLEKASLQLSLYARLLGIKKAGIVELTNEGYYFHPLELWDEEDVQKVLKDFKLAQLSTYE